MRRKNNMTPAPSTWYANMWRMGCTAFMWSTSMVPKPPPLKTSTHCASWRPCRGTEIEWGGGIKSAEALTQVFEAGARYAVVGSVAATKPELFEAWLHQFGAERMVLGADVKNGLVAVNGWLDSVDQTIDSLIDRFVPHGLTQVICTEISRDGMLQGPDTDLYVRLQQKYPTVDITVSGGISGMNDIEQLRQLGLRKVIVGKAIYEGRITLDQLC